MTQIIFNERKENNGSGLLSVSPLWNSDVFSFTFSTFCKHTLSIQKMIEYNDCWELVTSLRVFLWRRDGTVSCSSIIFADFPHFLFLRHFYWFPFWAPTFHLMATVVLLKEPVVSPWTAF